MEQKACRRKRLRRKYKRYAAAVAGAAILSGAALPGMPVKAAVVDNQFSTPSTRVEQSVSTDLHKPMQQVISERYHGDKDSNDQSRWHKKYRHRYYDTSDRYVSSDGSVVVRYSDSPVDTIKENAAYYGFDSRDTFSFRSLSSRTASLLVTKHDTGEKFEVALERGRYGSWRVVEIRSIGF